MSPESVQPAPESRVPIITYACPAGTAALDGEAAGHVRVCSGPVPGAGLLCCQPLPAVPGLRQPPHRRQQMKRGHVEGHVGGHLWMASQTSGVRGKGVMLAGGLCCQPLPAVRGPNS